MVVTHVGSKTFLSAAARLWVAVFACALSCHAQEASPAGASRVRPARELSPALRELRTDVVRTPDVAGRVVLDVRKIVGSGEAAADRIVATDLAGNAVPLDAVAGSRVAVAARPDQWVIVRPASIAPQAMQKGVQWLPGICLAPGASPEAAKEVFSSYADFATVPVAWDTAIDAYRLEGAVGVARNGDLAQGGAIGRTATVKLQFNGVSDATPTEFAVEDAALPDHHSSVGDDSGLEQSGHL